MLSTPFLYEESLSPEDFQKIGELLLRCSHIEHVLGNCLKAMLRITDEEAIVMVFPLGIEHRFQRIKELAKSADLNAEAKAALVELAATLSHVQTARNDLAHGIINDKEDEPTFHRRSNRRSVSKDDAFSAEELINFVAHATLSLRLALGGYGKEEGRHILPPRPPIPMYLGSPGK